MRVLLVEDNEELAELLALRLTACGFSIDHAVCAGLAREALSEARYHAVILDLGLPDRDGSELLGDMRARQDFTPVVVVTARGSRAERVSCLALGADDFLSKPFAVEELVTRLRALPRRRGCEGDLLQSGAVAAAGKAVRTMPASPQN
jgi:DNA-binding response OmpR family regulator